MRAASVLHERIVNGLANSGFTLTSPALTPVPVENA